MNLTNIILIIIMIALCSYVIGKSSIRYNVKYVSLILFFLVLHTLGLLVSEIENVIPILNILGGALGVLLTYSIWFIKKPRKGVIDYLKIIWLMIFIFSYLYTYLQYNSYSSEKGPHVLAGLNNSICHSEIIRLQFIYITIIALISILVHRDTNRKLIEN